MRTGTLSSARCVDRYDQVAGREHGQADETPTGHPSKILAPRVTMTDRNEIEELYSSHAPRLLQFLARMVGSAEAADLLQDVFVRALRSKAMPAETSQQTNWLFRVATNLAIDHLRRRQRWTKVAAVLRFRSESAPDGNEERVRAALLEIPANQAAALVLRLCEGLSRGEVADVLGISEAALKSRLVRGRLNFVAAYKRVERL